MAFSDEDLKRLKDHLSGDAYLTTEWMDARDLMPALLARLKAAEEVCDLTFFHFGGQKENLTPMVIELRDSAEAWRKACGR